MDAVKAALELKGLVYKMDVVAVAISMSHSRHEANKGADAEDMKQDVQVFKTRLLLLKAQIIGMFPQFARITGEARDSMGALRGFEQILESLYWADQLLAREDSDSWGMLYDFSYIHNHSNSAPRNMEEGFLTDEQIEEIMAKMYEENSQFSRSRIVDTNRL